MLGTGGSDSSTRVVLGKKALNSITFVLDLCRLIYRLKWIVWLNMFTSWLSTWLITQNFSLTAPVGRNEGEETQIRRAEWDRTSANSGKTFQSQRNHDEGSKPFTAMGKTHRASYQPKQTASRCRWSLSGKLITVKVICTCIRKAFNSINGITGGRMW